MTFPQTRGTDAPPGYRHLYVHVPFCGRRCSYCDFSIAVRRVTPVTEYVDALDAEMATRAIRLDAAELRSIYLGGGTPSKLGGAGVSGVLGAVARRAGVENPRSLPGDVEITIEVNPEDVTPESVAAWAAAGVNRASVGAQSFDPRVLHWMHREHSPERTREAVAGLRAGGIGNISLDLIFAVPEALGRDWGRDLEEAMALEPDHVSLYGLTVEPRTPLGRWTARGESTEAPEERYEAEFLEAHRRLRAAGLEHYEVSNYGRPGRRAVHNSAYWSGVPYLGIGPSAHGFDGRVRRWNIAAYTEWLQVVRGGGDPMAGQEEIGPAERLAETVYLGLRTSDGLVLHQNEWTMVTSWISAGWGTRVGDRLVLSALGWLRLDSLAASLTAFRSRS